MQSARALVHFFGCALTSSRTEADAPDLYALMDTYEMAKPATATAAAWMAPMTTAPVAAPPTWQQQQSGNSGKREEKTVKNKRKGNQSPSKPTAIPPYPPIVATVVECEARVMDLDSIYRVLPKRE